MYGYCPARWTSGKRPRPSASGTPGTRSSDLRRGLRGGRLRLKLGVRAFPHVGGPTVRAQGGTARRRRCSSAAAAPSWPRRHHHPPGWSTVTAWRDRQQMFTVRGPDGGGNPRAIAQSKLKRMLAHSDHRADGLALLGTRASSAATPSAGNAHSPAMFYVGSRADDAGHLRPVVRGLRAKRSPTRDIGAAPPWVAGVMICVHKIRWLACRRWWASMPAGQSCRR